MNSSHRTGRLRQVLRRLRDSERGQGLVEYALIISVVSLGSLAALHYLSGSISDLFNRAGASLAAGADTGGSGGGGGGGGGLTAQTITFGSTAPANATVGGPTYTPTATATSGLTVTLTIDASASSVCSISGGGVVSFQAIGTCKINADQAGNGSYNPAPQVQQSFAVGLTSQTITFGALSNRLLGSGTFTVSATASSGLPVAFTSATTSKCTVSGTTVTLVAVGTCTINANQAGNGTYAAAPQAQQSFTIGAAPAAPADNQSVDSSMSLVGGGNSAATIVGSYGGRWYSQTMNGRSGSPDISGGAVMRDYSGWPFYDNPTAGSACGFTLANGFAFTGKTWHSGEWDEPGSGNNYEWACY